MIVLVRTRKTEAKKIAAAEPTAATKQENNNQDQYTAESLKSQIKIVGNISVEVGGRKYRLCYVPEEVLK